MYMHPLASCEFLYNARTDEEKLDLLRHAFDEPGEPEGQDGLEKALQLPGLDIDTATVIVRYQGVCQRYFMTYTKDPDEQREYYQKVLECFARARELAISTGNENAQKLIDQEQKKLESVMKDLSQWY